jgi:hypothetical protein
MLSTLLALFLLAQTPIEAHTGKSGATLFITAAKTAPVITTPTLTVNGNVVALTPGPVSRAFWSWSLPAPVTRDLSIAISAPAGWARGAPALSMPVVNYAGRVEFSMPATTTMGLGVNIPHMPLFAGSLYCPVRNWATRLGTFRPGVLATDAAGNPTRIPGPVSASVSVARIGNGVDSANLPTLSGLFTVVYDTTDPLTELSLTKWDKTTVCTARPDLSSPGVNGIGVTKVFQISQPTGNSPCFQLTVSHPQNTPRYSNLWIIPPDNPLDRSNPFAVEASVLRQLSVGSGRGPLILRWIDSCASYMGVSNVVDASDLPGVSKTSWVTPGRTITAAVSRFRPVDLTVSPTVQTLYGPIALANLKPWDLGGRCVVEAVTPAPHGITTGQQVAFDLPARITTTAGGATLVIPRNSRSVAWVTSPTTFIFTVGIRTPSGPPTIDAPIDVVGTASVTLLTPLPGAVMPYEFAAEMTSQFQGAILWIPIPHAASDACVDAIASKVLAHILPGQKVIVEYSNECWNWGPFPQPDYVATMSRLLGYQNIGRMFYARRALEVAARFRAVFAKAGQQNNVLSVFAWQFGGMQGYLTNCVRAGMGKADVIAMAPYFGMPRAWAPRIAGWSSAQLHDLFRHYLVLDPEPLGEWQDWINGVSAYEAAMGPTLHYTYEGGTEHGIPLGWPGRPAAAAWDLSSHPDAADTERVMYAQCQSRGLNGFTYYAHLMEVTHNGANWGLWNYQGQSHGTGDGSDGRAVNAPIGTGKAWVPTLSVRGEAWRQWQQSYWMGGAH